MFYNLQILYILYILYVSFFFIKKIFLKIIIIIIIIHDNINYENGKKTRESYLKIFF